MRESSEFRITMRTKKYKEQEGICAYCNELIYGKPSLDHVIPVYQGGDSYDENFVVCCPKCNISKLDYIVFTNLEDRIIYPMISMPFIFKWNYITTNNFKGEKK